MSIVQPGQHEGLKLGVHAAFAVLALTCGMYNVLALHARREPHLAWNLLVYLAVSWYEVVQVRRHLRSL